MLKIDNVKVIEYLNELKLIFDDIYNEYAETQSENLHNMLQVTGAKINAIKTILNSNGYSVDYKNDSHIIY